MTIRVEETNEELERIAANNLAKGDWDISILPPVMDLIPKNVKLKTPSDTLTHIRVTSMRWNARKESKQAKSTRDEIPDK